MKKSYILLAIFTVIISNISIAQKVENTQSPVIKKGYYSIGNNSNKIRKGLFSKPDTIVPHEMSKGYYTIGSGSKVAEKRKWWRAESRPMATKGYYTIGVNPEKKPDSSRSIVAD